MFFKKKAAPQPAAIAETAAVDEIRPEAPQSDDLALAEHLDAEGRHEEAVDALRRAWVDGSIEATRRLGERLLIGRDVAPFPQEGFALINSAAERGDADALCLMANLSGAGSMTPQSWPKAFDYLAQAADRGAERARAQLRLLSGRTGSDWRAMAAAIDIDAWLTPPERQAICESPRVRIAKNLCPPEVCDWLVEAARLKLKPALMYDGALRKPVLADSRRCSEYQFDILDSDVALLLVRAKIAALTKMPIYAFEPPQVFHYKLGDEIKAHYDFVRGDSEGYGRSGAFTSERIVSSLVYLNDDYEGGELDFIKGGVKHKGRKGDIVFFANVDLSGAPDRQTLHAGLPVTRGEKWMLSQWIHNQPFSAAV